MPSADLEGRALVVTGAGRGIGRAIATDLAARGARLLLNDRGCELDGSGGDPAVVEQVARQIVAAGGEAVPVADDLRDGATASTLVERCVTELGRLDGLVNAAGIRRDRGILHVTDDDLDAHLDLHARASFRLTREAAKAMIATKRGGAIVHLTGPVAFFGAARQAAAGAAAAAVCALTRSAAVELRKHGIRINAVAATARTRATEDLPMFRGVREDSMSPAHVAPVVAFLVSQAGQAVTGEVVGVAGGRLYGLKARETTGVFAEGRPFTLEEVATGFAEAMRGGGREER